MAGATSLVELILKKWGDDAAKVAAPAAGVMAAGQSEDADAGFVTKGGKALLEAFHGSPHKFDKFSMDQIGTGEGAQAYGHGLYFADSEDVARQYRDTLSLNGYQDNDANYSKALELGLSAGEFDRFEGMVRMAATKDGLDEGRISADLQEYLQWPDDSMPALESFVGDYLNTLPKGALYRTEIDVTPESLLDWDAMLDEQPKAVQEAIESTDWWDYAAEDLWNGADNPTGGSLVRWLSDDGPEFGSQQLNDAGIKGIKYLDGDSRAAGDGTSNYVIFDDSLINIAERGNADPRLLGATAAGTAGLLAAPLLADKDKPLPVPTWGDVGESVGGVLSMPMTGLQGIARGLYGLATGEDVVTAGAEAAGVMGSEHKGSLMTPGMDSDKGADRLEKYVTEKTGDESLGWMAKMGLLLGGI